MMQSICQELPLAFLKNTAQDVWMCCIWLQGHQTHIHPHFGLHTRKFVYMVSEWEGSLLCRVWYLCLIEWCTSCIQLHNGVTHIHHKHRINEVFPNPQASGLSEQSCGSDISTPSPATSTATWPNLTDPALTHKPSPSTLNDRPHTISSGELPALPCPAPPYITFTFPLSE